MIPIVIKGHERPLSQVRYNRDGDLLISTARDRVVSVWFSENGERLGTLGPHGGSVMTVDIDNESTFVVTGSAEYALHFWNLKTGEHISAITLKATPRFVQLHPHGKQNKLLVIQDEQMGQISSIFIYDIDMNDLSQPKFSEVAVYERKESPFVKAVWSYDGRHIIAGHRDGSISRIDSETGEVLLNKKVHKEPITDIQMSPDLSYFVSSSRDSTVALMETDGDFESVRKVFQGDVPLNSAAISPIKDIIIAGGGMNARDVTTSAGGKFEAHFFQKVFMDDLGRLGGHFGPINTIAIHPHGTSFASGGEDGYVRINHFDKSYFDFEYAKAAPVK